MTAPAQLETPRPDSAALIKRFGEAVRMLTYDQVTLVAGKPVRQEYADAKATLLAEITAKDAEIARLRAALAPFAKFAETVAQKHPGWDHDDFDFGTIGSGWSSDATRLPTMGDYRRARAALAGEPRT